MCRKQSWKLIKQFYMATCNVVLMYSSETWRVNEEIKLELNRAYLQAIRAITWRRYVRKFRLHHGMEEVYPVKNKKQKKHQNGSGQKRLKTTGISDGLNLNKNWKIIRYYGIWHRIIIYNGYMETELRQIYLKKRGERGRNVFRVFNLYIEYKII